MLSLMRGYVRGEPCALRRNGSQKGISSSTTTRNTSRGMPPPSTPTSHASIVRSSSLFGPSITAASATTGNARLLINGNVLGKAHNISGILSFLGTHNFYIWPFVLNELGNVHVLASRKLATRTKKATDAQAKSADTSTTEAAKRPVTKMPPINKRYSSTRCNCVIACLFVLISLLD